MAELIKVNKKVINDPLYTPVIKFLKDRIASLEVTGPADELALSKQRYDGLVAGDLVIESAIKFPDDVVRVCIISRKTGFARVDIDIKYVQMETILEDFAVPMVEINDVEQLKTYIKSLEEPIQPTLLYLKYKETYGVLITQEQATTHEGAMTAFGDLFFENYVLERESLNSIDWESLESGTVTITDPSFGRGVYPLFIYELALSEAQLPEITSNLPAEVTSRRGESFQIPNTYWFAGNQDITTVASIELSTRSGYAILERSSDLLDIDGETIYGSSKEDVTDEIVVRVSYTWNDRLVRKNFYIKLLIEKDLPNDLVITSVPTEVTATNGDVVEVKVTATYKGDVVEILIPPPSFKSQKGFGNLSYVKTNSDMSMVYQGKVNVTFPDFEEKVTDLWSADFSINDDGNIATATGFINGILVKPDVLPKFTVTGVPTLLEGYLNDTGSYKPVVKYGDQVISLNEVNLSTGPQGSKQLVDINNVTDTTVNWKLINNSGTPGQAIRDTFTQTYSWLDPQGVLQSKSFTITVNVKLDSIIKIIPGIDRHVRRYDFGGVTWTFEVNGVARNDLITGFSLDNPLGVDGENFIVNRPNIANQWFVINADPDNEVTLTGDFTFKATVDGSLQTFHVQQVFVVDKLQEGTPDGDNENPPPVQPVDPDNPNEQGTGQGGNYGADSPSDPGGSANPDSPGTGDGPYNAELTAVPTSYTIGGKSDRSHSMSFKVYRGTEDVTSNSVLMSEATIEPDYVTFDDIFYDAESDSFIVDYTKDKGGVSKGAIFAKLKTNASPTKRQIARVWVNVDVEQIKVLKVINPPSSTDLDIDVSKDVSFNVEFSGTKLALNDVNLKIEKVNTTPTKITSVGEDAITLLNDTWNRVGTTVTETTTLRFSYTDPADNKKYVVDVPFDFIVTYPPMELIYTGPTELDVSIWDTGTFPIKLQAGEKDLTSYLTGTVIVSGNKYVSVNKLDWEVFFAESTETSQIVGINVSYTVGYNSGTLSADFKFNIAAWDGITFASTAHSPDQIAGASGDQGNITASFVFKGKDATENTQLDVAKSVIPNTVILGTVSYDSEKGLVIPYTLTRGGTGTMELVFLAPDSTTVTTSIDFDTDVSWPQDLNIEESGKDIRGYWDDEYSYPLVLNFSGTKVPLTDENLTLVFSSGNDSPITLTETLAESLELFLAKGGNPGTSYDYTVTIDLTYLNQEDNKSYTKQLIVPATIRVPEVKVGYNPLITGNVFQHGKIPITLVDEIGNNIAIKVYDVTGAGSNVGLLEPDEWYITNGSQTGQVTGELPLRLTYEMGGSDRTIDVVEKFTINKWDGVYFKANPDVSAISGNGGDTGQITFNPTYQGFSSPNATIDLTRSDIPDNIILGEMDENNTLPYTLSGNDTTNMVICVVRTGAVEPMREGVDYSLVNFSVKSISTNLPFTLVRSDSNITLGWGETGTIKFTTQYGDNELASNTPGLTVKLADADVHGITIVRQTKDGVLVKATRSNVPGATKVYPEMFDISYNVGATEPKTATFNTDVTINMGQVSIADNDVVSADIWSKGTFQQKVQFNQVTMNTVDHFDLQSPDNTYVEVTQPRGYEIIGAEEQTSTQSIPMVIYYKVDETDELQSLNFEAKFRITGSTSVRFTVDTTPSSIEGSLDNDSVITCTPVYKGKNVGAQATFKPALSTIPEQLTLKDYKVVGNNYVITFVGAKAGLGNLDLVFWSPDAGNDPKPRDIFTSRLSVKVMGELGVEIGTRDNLITGKNADTGVYKLQILFGGVPIDAAAEIANGNLVATREVGAASSTNANVLNISKWEKEAFDYALNGCVIPGSVANVSDFINLTYKYGGVNYSRRVEIPLRYTSSAPAFGNWPTGVLKVYSSGSLAPTATCDGVDIASGIASISNQGDTADQYIKLNGTAKTYDVIWGEQEDITHDVSARVVGQYRTWAWAANVVVPFTIGAWNQKTWDPDLSGSPWSTYLDLTGRVDRQINLTAYLKNGRYSGFTSSTGNLLLNDKTDLLDLVDLIYKSVGSTTTQFYQMTAKKPGTGKLKLCWKNPESTATPGVENIDYTYTSYDVEVKENSLVGSGSGTGGSGDVVSLGLVVSLLSTSAQVRNDNANLVIAPVDETVLKITGKAASTITCEITASPDVPDGVVNVPLNFTYTDPNTGYVTKGTYNYPLTIKRPSDWPVVTALDTNTLRPLYQYGGNLFKVTVGGTDVSTNVSPVSCVTTNNGAEYMVMSKNVPVAGTWWWIAKAPTSSSQGTVSSTVRWTLDVPYRGGTVKVTGDYTFRITYVENQKPFVGNPTSVSIRRQPINTEFEIPFGFLWRNYPWKDVVLNQALSTNFTTAYDYVSQRVEGDIVYLKVKQKVASPPSTVDFVWDLNGVASPSVPDSRTTVNGQIFALTLEALGTQPNWDIWATRNIANIFTVKDGTTDVTKSVTLLSMSNSMFKIITANSADTGPVVRIESDAARAAETVNVTYRVQASADYNNDIYEITVPANINAFDGNQMFVKDINPTNALTAIDDVGLVNFTPYFRQTLAANASWISVNASTFESLNSGLVKAGTLSVVGSGSGAYIRYTYTALKSFKGKIKIPVTYSGPGSTNWPAGTAGKNYLVIEQDVRFYEKKLAFYPDDTTPSKVSGKYNTTVFVPCTLQYGPGVGDSIPANSAQLTPVLSSSTVVSLDSRTATGIYLKILYDNKTSNNVDYNVDITWTYRADGSSTVLGTRQYTQTVTLEGSGAGDSIVITNLVEKSGDVWSTGSLPFGITLNGTAVSAAAMVVDVQTNDYVRNLSNTYTAAYEIYNGKTTAYAATVPIKVTWSDGVITRSVTQNCIFNISAYDGIDLKVNLYSLNSFNNGLAAVVNGTAAFRIIPYYRGSRQQPMPGTTFGVWNSKTVVPGFVGNPAVSGSATNVGQGAGVGLAIYTYTAGSTDMAENATATIYYGFLNKENDATAVEGKDYVKILMPCYVYIAAKYYPISNDPTLSGSYGTGTTPTYTLNMRVRRGITAANMNSMGTGGIVFSPSDVINTSAQSTTSITTYFPNELTTAKQKTTKVKITVGPTSVQEDYKAVFNVDVTQISNWDFPTVSGLQTVEASILDTGSLPFKLMDGTTDVTSQATITAISQNDYIDLVSGKWRVYNARTGDTTLTVTFTYTITYHGHNLTLTQDVTYLVKGYNTNPTTANVQSVTGSLGDKGSALPFKLQMNGKDIPSAWITGMTGSSPNNRVTVGPALTDYWEIVSASTTQALVENVTYTMTINNGKRTWTVNQVIVFNINRNGSDPDTISATGTSEPFTYGEEGKIVLTGTVGSNTLAGHVVFDGPNSDGAGLVEFGSMSPNQDGSINIAITGVKAGSGTAVVRINALQPTGNVSGVDYLDVSVPVEVDYAPLSEGDNFQTSVANGSSPTTADQWVYGPESE